MVAQTASTRSMSEFFAGVRILLRVYATRKYIQHDYLGIHAMRILSMSAVLFADSVLPIDIRYRYQVSVIRCSVRLILSVSRLLPVLRIECDNAHTVRVLFSH